MSANELKIRSIGGHLFGFEVVLYLFLGGLGGGLSVVAGVSGLVIPHQFSEDGSLPGCFNLMRSSFVTAASALLLGSLFLLADSNNYSAMTYLFLAPPFGYLSVGAWLVVINMVLCITLVLFWGTGATSPSTLVSRALHAACAVVGLAVALYTGLFLSSMKAVPLWSSFLIPSLFGLSSISCGIVLFLALTHANDTGSIFPAYKNLLAKTDLGMVALELFCAAALILGLISAPVDGPTAAAGAASAQNLVVGAHSWIWWGGFVGFGLIATAILDVLVILIKKGWSGHIWSTLGMSFCVLVGAFSLRYCIVMTGIHPVLGF